MSRPMADTPKRRARRQFNDEFKAQAVRLVLDEGKTVGAVARDLDLTETALREWVKRARADRTQGQDRPDDRRARGARTPAEGESGAPAGARDLKKSRGLLRERASERFALIHARKAIFPIATLCRRSASRRAGTTPGADVRSRRTPSAISGCACSCARRSTRASSATAARGFTTICASRGACEPQTGHSADAGGGPRGAGA